MPDDSCLAPSCERSVYSKSYCEPHYRRWRKYGAPGGPIRERINGTPEQRFWPKVDLDGPSPGCRPDLGPCWVWRTTASTTNGYAQFRADGQMRIAHRFAWELVVGPIPEGLELDHLCRNRRCVRPSHLEPVTLAENNARTRGHRYRPTCNDGHEMTAANTYWYGPRKAKRGCRECRRAAQRRYRARRRAA